MFNLKRQLQIIFFVFIVFYSAILINLFILQVIQSSFFTSIAQSQYNNQLTMIPSRGEIYDRKHRILAINIPKSTAFVIPGQVKHNKELMRFLKKYYPPSYEKLRSNPPTYFMYIKRHLTAVEEDHIKQSNFSEIHLLKENHRFYPLPECGAVVGFVDIDNKGLMGVEYWFDKYLSGTPSTYVLQADARSGHYYFKKETQIKGTDGQPLTLTIDAGLQFLAHEELKETVQHFQAKEGAVLILDPCQGDIIVMTQYPDFNPNDEEHHDIENTKNKLVTETYELGSVMKIFTALAALEENVVTADELIDCRNTKTTVINGMHVNTTKEHGLITFSDVIAFSNNIGSALIAQRLGNKLYDHYRRCGFGEKTSLHFPGEQKGFVNDPANWSKQSIFSLSYGYEIRATLLQLACAFGLLATNGIVVKPRLLFEEVIPTKNTTPLYRSETIQTMREILKRTIRHGTARRANITGYEILGKTGTANTLVDGHYDNTRNIFTFIGLVEKDNYKRIIVTFVKEAAQPNLFASSVTTPLFERIVQKMLIHDNII